MSESVINLNNSQLSRISTVFSTIQPGWTQKVEVIYTKDKSGKEWALLGSADNTAGVMTSSSLRKSVKFLYAKVTIDLSMVTNKINVSLTLKRGGGYETQTSKASLNEKRQQLFQTLTHELLHVIQAWVWGGEDSWAAQYQQARQDVFSKSFFSESRKENPGYANRYELAAFRYGTQWVSEHRTQLNNGDFDDMIPIEYLKNN